MYSLYTVLYQKQEDQDKDDARCLSCGLVLNTSRYRGPPSPIKMYRGPPHQGWMVQGRDRARIGTKNMDYVMRPTIPRMYIVWTYGSRKRPSPQEICSCRDGIQLVLQGNVRDRACTQKSSGTSVIWMLGIFLEQAQQRTIYLLLERNVLLDYGL